MRLAKLKLFEREGLHESHPGEIDGLLQVSDDSWEMTGVGLGFPERGVNEIAGIQQFGGRTDGFLGASAGTVSAEAVLEGNRLALLFEAKFCGATGGNPVTARRLGGGSVGMS